MLINMDMVRWAQYDILVTANSSKAHLRRHRHNRNFHYLDMWS